MCKAEWGWDSDGAGSMWNWRRGDSEDFTTGSACYELRKPNHKTTKVEKLDLHLRLQTGDYLCRKEK
ncbi:hypothetical protein MRB53_001325 [Persea americana]|uniref:Uncharacterized protein n=1 Tax=Persea americana TaxID=3435 RepID=A0ACC2MTR6_PERAE|nr:hypothetical protein MRB53_001325 [Persea americana]